jgi:DNA-binding NarL/FixJ family response regulator
MTSIAIATRRPKKASPMTKKSTNKKNRLPEKAKKKMEMPPQRSGGVMNVFLLDDHPIVRRGISELIQQEADLRVCGEADNAAQALAAIGALKPDMVIVDIGINGSSNGIEFLKSLKEKFPALPALVLSMHDEILYAERVLSEGAKGYLMKQEGNGKIVSAVRRILSGQTYLSDDMTARVLEKQYGGVSAGISPREILSARELQVFQLIGNGIATTAIAKQLNCSVKTIETHRARIKGKLNLKHNMELVRYSVQWAQENW